MPTNAEMFTRSDAARDDIAAHVRTQYVIKLASSAVYACASHHTWRENMNDALRFDFMTSATAYAVYQLDLSPHAFTIEAV